jgi:ribonuclease D
MAKPADKLPSYPRPHRFVKDRRKEEMMKRLKVWREAKAGELGIEAGILVNNSMLEAVAEAVCCGQDGAVVVPPMKMWQKEAFGKELLLFVKNHEAKSEV